MVGRQLACYDITEKIGEGGMGEVYRATDSRLNREVAIKLLPPSFGGDSRRRQRFEREAQIVASINDSRVVTIYSVEREDGLDFLTMELVEGQTLEEILPDDGFELPQLLKIGTEICYAVAAAHERGITHRDLKPANVMVDERSRVKVLDFGVAKEIHDVEDPSDIPTADGGKGLLTRPGNVIGTVPYMAPEQLKGEGATLRSDVFSLGVLLYEMATGERPFGAKTHAELITQIMRDRPESIRDRKPGFPIGVWRIIERCLEKKPENRFESAAEVAEALADLRVHFDTGTITVPIPIRSLLPVDPGRRRLLLLAAVFVVLLVAGGSGALWRSLSDHEEVAAPLERLGVVPFENIGSDDYEQMVRGLNETLVERLLNVRGLAVVSKMASRVAVDEGTSVKEVGERLDVEHILDGEILWDEETQTANITIALIHVPDEISIFRKTYFSEPHNRGETNTDIAVDIARELEILRPSEDQEVIKMSDVPEATNAYLRGVTLKNGESDFQAIEHFREAVEHDPEFALAWAELAMAASQQYYNGTRDPQHGAEARGALARARELAPSEVAVQVAEGLVAFRVDDDLDDAASTLERALARAPSDVDLLQAIALVAVRRGDSEAAIEYLESARRLSPVNARLADRLATTCLFSRRFHDAARYAGEALAISPSLTSAAWTKVQATLAIEGTTLSSRAFVESSEVDSAGRRWLMFQVDFLDRRWSQAVEGIRGVLEDVSNQRPTDDYLRFALALDALDERSSGEQVLRSAFEASLRWQEQDPDAFVMLSRAFSAAAMGRSEDAISFVEQASDIAADDDLYRVRILEGEAMILSALRRSEAALDRLEKLVRAPYGVALSSASLKIDPVWDPLRNLEGWEEIVDLAVEAENGH